MNRFVWIPSGENCGWYTQTRKKMADTSWNVKKKNNWWTSLWYTHEGVSSSTERTHFSERARKHCMCGAYHRVMWESFVCNFAAIRWLAWKRREKCHGKNEKDDEEDRKSSNLQWIACILLKYQCKSRLYCIARCSCIWFVRCARFCTHSSVCIVSAVLLAIVARLFFSFFLPFNSKMIHFRVKANKWTVWYCNCVQLLATDIWNHSVWYTAIASYSNVKRSIIVFPRFSTFSFDRFSRQKGI